MTDTSQASDGMGSSLLDALDKLARALRFTDDPDGALLKMAETVRDHLQADGAKVFAVRRSLHGPALAQLCRTDWKGDISALPREKLLPISNDKGLADWVVLRDDWLLIGDMEASGPAERRQVRGNTGKHGCVVLKPRSEAEYLEEEASPVHDEEKSMLLVPMHSKGKPAGVIAVWRLEEGRPFEVNDELQSLLRIVPHLETACRQILHIETVLSELDAIAGFTRDLNRSNSLGEGYKAVAKGVNRLAHSAHAVLFHRDRDYGNNLYHRAVWSAADTERTRLHGAFRGFHVEGRFNHPQKELELRSCIGKRLKEFGITNLQCRQILREIDLEASGPESRMLALLLDERFEDRRIAYFADDLLAHAAKSFLHYSSSMLSDHIRIYAHKVVDEIAGYHKATVLEPTQVLEEATRLLKKATNASGALVYTGPAGQLKVTHSYPPSNEILGLGVAPGSLTEKSVESRRILRIVDTKGIPSPSEFDRKTLARIQRAFGWQEVRSWLCCPVVLNKRCIGLIKLLTSQRQTFLGLDHQSIAEIVASSTAWEMTKATRQLMLKDLTRRANELTSKHGRELAKELTVSLEQWACQFLKPDSKVAFAVRVSPSKRRLFSEASDGIPPSLLLALDSRSRHHNLEEIEWEDWEIWRSEPPLPASTAAGIGVPIRLPGNQRLEGHLYILHEMPFSAMEKEAAVEAAREFAILFDRELLRRELQQSMGRFRHAVLGPVQGLVSAGKLVMRRAKEAGVSLDILNPVGQRIREEAEILRLWRENQRLYMSERIELRPRKQALRPVFERCIARYQDSFRARHIRFSEIWLPKGEVQLVFDDTAIDLALSNLLDNAYKYAFRNRRASAGVELVPRGVNIWVEDIGHPVPDDFKNRMYKEGERLEPHDPFRIIEGEGLGLAMTTAIIKEHDGDLLNDCKQVGQSEDQTKIPYQVRFTIVLPR